MPWTEWCNCTADKQARFVKIQASGIDMLTLNGAGHILDPLQTDTPLTLPEWIPNDSATSLLSSALDQIATPDTVLETPPSREAGLELLSTLPGPGEDSLNLESDRSSSSLYLSESLPANFDSLSYNEMRLSLKIWRNLRFSHSTTCAKGTEQLSGKWILEQRRCLEVHSS